MEPLRVAETSRHRAGLADLAVELAAQAAGFRRSLPEGVLTALADLVRAMNCYYSWTRWTPAAFGPSPAVLPATCAPTRPISPPATCRAATTSTAAAR
jgi:hypothetical protein